MQQSPEALIVEACQRADERLRAARELSCDPRFNGLLDMLERINGEQRRIAASLDEVNRQLCQLSKVDRAA